ncbi:hypothetical protein ARTHRO9V_280003 [Arthrobacter sp. 9V]|nr:hypothetical protein ARTHRO9V_280003 [Arthrobacter sp. 9V]
MPKHAIPTRYCPVFLTLHTKSVRDCRGRPAFFHFRVANASFLDLHLQEPVQASMSGSAFATVTADLAKVVIKDSWTVG